MFYFKVTHAGVHWSVYMYTLTHAYVHTHTRAGGSGLAARSWESGPVVNGEATSRPQPLSAAYPDIKKNFRYPPLL